MADEPGVVLFGVVGLLDGRLVFSTSKLFARWLFNILSSANAVSDESERKDRAAYLSSDERYPLRPLGQPTLRRVRD